MKYKDYYAILGVARNADEATIKKAYRKLAHKYHPDVSKDPQGEAKFKEIAEAYATLKDPEKRAAYDQLGKHAPGEDFRPPPDWGRRFGGSQHSFEDIDLSDLFAEFFGRGHRAGGRRGPMPIPGEDYEVTAQITLEDAYRGAEVNLDLSVPELDEGGMLRRVPRSFKARIPKGATDGHRLRLRGKLSRSAPCALGGRARRHRAGADAWRGGGAQGAAGNAGRAEAAAREPRPA